MATMQAHQPKFDHSNKPMKAAEHVVRKLVANGVDVIFGHPGGAVLPIYDALYQAPIRHILVRHEQAAAHMADGYARATGKPGVCMATSGPGATNLVTGLATAHMDSIPMIAITGNVPTHLIGTDAFQEADIVGISRPVTKHNYLVQRPEDLPRIIDEAFSIATKGRPGPVLIDIPRDVSVAMFDPKSLPSSDTYFGIPSNSAINNNTNNGSAALKRPSTLSSGNLRQVKRAAQAIAQAKKPVLYIGGGVIASAAEAEILALAEKANLPTTFTLMGIGAFPGDHPLSLGMLGLHGTAYANYAMASADLIIAVGARFDDRVTGRVSDFGKDATIVHIDVDPAEIDKIITADIPISGDAKLIVSHLLKEVQPKKSEAWLAQIDQWKNEYPLRYPTRPGVIAPQKVIEELYHVTQGEALCTADVGQHQMWLAQYYRFRRSRSHLSSGGLGTMGFGFPAAIGAKLADPGRSVWSITGDGGFQMNLQELATCAAHNIAVKVAVLNNSCLGMVRQLQELVYDHRYIAIDLGSPEFTTIARGFGVAARRVDDPSELRPALEWAQAHNGPVVLDIRIDPEANVYPMVPAGAALNEMIGIKGSLEDGDLSQPNRSGESEALL